MRPDSPPPSGSARHGLAWLPVPLFLLAIVGLWVADLRAAWPLAPLSWIVHYGSTAMSISLIVLPAALGFLANGQAPLLMLGSGMLILDIGVLAMPTAFARSTSAAFAIYNTAALLSALCQFAGMAIVARRSVRLERPVRWLMAAYAGGAAFMGLVIWAGLAGAMPSFFVDNQGATPLRTLVVCMAAVFLALTAGLLGKTYRREPSPFFFWYGLGLLLWAEGLTASLLIAVQDSLLQWVTRFTQFTGIIYLCLAVLLAVRESGAPGLPLAAIEKAWRRKEFLPAVRIRSLVQAVLRYASAVGAVALGFVAWLAATKWVGPGLPTFITFYPAVIIVALLAGPGPGVLATALTGAAVAYWIMPPVGQFLIASPVDRLALVLFGAMGLLISAAAEAYRRSRIKAAAYDREAALAETRRENEFLANLLDHASQPFAVGYPDGRLGRLNRAYEELTGYTAAELRTLDRFTTLTPPEWREPERKNLAELNRTGKPVRYEKEYIRKDGSRVPVELVVHLVLDAAGEPDYYYSFITDITERKWAVGELRRNEARWNAAIESFAEGAIIATEDEQVIYWNPAAREMHGFTRHDERIEPLEKTPVTFQLWTPDAGHLLTLDEWPMRRIKRGESVRNLELRIRRPDQGWEKVFSYSGAMVHTVGGERLIFLTCHDLTELRRAEGALRMNERRLINVLESMPDAFVSFDTDMRYTYVNANAERLQAARREELIGRDTRVVYSDAESAKTIDLYEQVIREQKPATLASYHAGFDRWVEVRAFPTSEGVSVFYKDVSAEMKAEHSLRESEERYRAYFDTAAVGTTELGLDGRFLRVNERFCGITGYSSEELLRMTLWDLTHPDDREREDKRRSAFLRGESQAFQTEKRYVRKGGRIVWVHVVEALVRDPAGKALYSAGVIRDVTQRRAAEEELRRSADELQAANAELRASQAAALNLMEDADAARRRAEQAAEALRAAHDELAKQVEERTRELREKEVLLKEVHHRVKNNLQVISSLVGLQADGSKNKTIREVLQDVTYRVRSMALVHEKLYQSADLARIDFAEYARSLLGYLWRAYGAAGAAVRLRFDLEPVSLPVDVAVPCGLILNELAGNALKHAFQGRAGGEVTVALTGPAEGRITLSVRDDGVGLPAGFDWRQARSLGLRLVQMLAGQLDATVEVGGGQGTTFALTFGYRGGEGEAPHPPLL